VASRRGIAIATTAIFVLGSGFGEQAPLLIDRVLEVAVGVGAGVLVNLVIIPPLRERQAARYVDNVNERMGKVLVSVAEEFSRLWETEKADTWFEECESIAFELDSAWEVVYFPRESRRGNPRMRSGAFGPATRAGTPRIRNRSLDTKIFLRGRTRAFPTFSTWHELSARPRRETGNGTSDSARYGRISSATPDGLSQTRTRMSARFAIASPNCR